MRRILPLLILLLAALGACKAGDDPRAPFTDSRIPPGLEHRFYPPQGWAWGLLKVGKAPPVRYGVAAPATTARGQIIILPAQGDVAEAWFGVVRDLNARGFVVWVLEGSGQGGSGRYRLPRDIRDAPSLDPDVVAVSVLTAQMAERKPRYLIASGGSGAVAVRAAGLGLGLDGLILIDPDLRTPEERRKEMGPDDVSKMRWMHRFGLGRLPPPGVTGARKDMPMETPGPGESAFLRWLTRRWQAANPDLRMGRSSVDWFFAYEAEASAARAAWPRLKTPTLVVSEFEWVTPNNICAGRANCRRVLSVRAPDRITTHEAFMTQILGFIDPSRAGLASSPAAATLDDQS